MSVAEPALSLTSANTTGSSDVRRMCRALLLPGCTVSGTSERTSQWEATSRTPAAVAATLGWNLRHGVGRQKVRICGAHARIHQVAQRYDDMAIATTDSRHVRQCMQAHMQNTNVITTTVSLPLRGMGPCCNSFNAGPTPAQEVVMIVATASAIFTATSVGGPVTWRKSLALAIAIASSCLPAAYLSRIALVVESLWPPPPPTSNRPKTFSRALPLTRDACLENSFLSPAAKAFASACTWRSWPEKYVASYALMSAVSTLKAASNDITIDPCVRAFSVYKKAGAKVVVLSVLFSLQLQNVTGVCDACCIQRRHATRDHD